MHLVILQTVAQLLFSLAFNVAFYNPPDTGSFACGLQGFLINFSMLSSILYTAFISGFMVSSIKLKRRVQLEMRTLVLLTICIVIFASAMAAMPFISDQYVNMGARCWIAEDEEGRDRYAGVMYRFLTHYVIVWAANIFIFASYFSIIKYLKMSAAKRTAYSDDRLIQRTIGTLLYYPGEWIAILHTLHFTTLCITQASNIYIHIYTPSLLSVFPAICFVVWTPVTCIRVFTAIDENLEVPIWAYGIAFSIAASEGAFFAIVFSQVYYFYCYVMWLCLYVWVYICMFACTNGFLRPLFGPKSMMYATHSIYVRVSLSSHSIDRCGSSCTECSSARKKRGCW
jgi:hypothetical protein